VKLDAFAQPDEMNCGTLFFPRFRQIRFEGQLSIGINQLQNAVEDIVVNLDGTEGVRPMRVQRVGAFDQSDSQRATALRSLADGFGVFGRRFTASETKEGQCRNERHQHRLYETLSVHGNDLFVLVAFLQLVCHKPEATAELP
jgi:hypothetical protein